jgi:ERCC4-type nuclease
MELEIDSRESTTRKESAYSYFVSEDYSVSVRQLPIGDFVFNKSLVFEYKTVSDFIGSVKDGRIFRQSRRMKQYPYSYILVEGDVFQEVHDRYENPKNPHYWKIRNGKEGDFTINQLLGSLATLHEYNHVIYVENMNQAFTIMKYLSTNILEKDKDVKAIEVPVCQMSDPVGTFLCCCDGVSVKKAVWIKNALHLETLRDLLDVTHKDLVSVKGIGSKTAASIMEVIG